ncbi:MAG: peptidase M48 [Bacteroidetes bacterium SW_9_63_38]|nr:MAG: peptidase M48 [Bacteroidetes bacterium SW_9_63_38]
MNDLASPQHFWTRQRVRLIRLLVPVVLVAVAGANTGCVTTGTNPISGNQRAYAYSWKEEVKLGTKTDKQIQKQYGIYEDKKLQQYVDRVAQQVLAESHMRRPSTPPKFRNTEFTFRVLDSPIINAFALPGGYVYVTRSLLAHLNNEVQLAVVLGHEIGHVAGRHASKQAAKKRFMKGILVGGAIAGQAALGGNVGKNVLGLGSSAAQLLSLSYSRDNERESDQLGVEYATMAGYDAAEGADFFMSLKRKQEQSGQSIPTWKSTHPDPGNREDTILQLAKKWEKRVAGTSDTRDQDDYYAAIENIVLGENPRQGFTENDVFYHPDLEFQFPVPRGWTVQNQTSQVAMVQPDQEAYVLFKISNKDTPAAAAGEFAGQKGLKVIERRRETINGRDAQRVLAEAQTQQGQTLRDLATFVAYDGRVYNFQGLTTAKQYNAYRSQLERPMYGFDALRDAEKLNVKPARLEIRPAPRSAPFRTFIDRSLLPDEISDDDLAIINQVKLGETVEQGRPLKLPTK